MKKIYTDDEWFGTEEAANEYINEELMVEDDYINIVNYKKKELGDGWLVVYSYTKK